MFEGEMITLYGIGSENPSIQTELNSAADSGITIRIWGDLDNKAQRVTGTVIDVNRLESVSP